MINEEMKNKLESHLKEIGWKLKPCGCNHFALVDHKKNVTDFHYFGGEISIRNEAISSVGFDLSKCYFSVSDKDTLTISASDEAFINLYSFSK